MWSKISSKSLIMVSILSFQTTVFASEAAQPNDATSPETRARVSSNDNWGIALSPAQQAMRQAALEQMTQLKLEQKKLPKSRSRQHEHIDGVGQHEAD